MAAANTLGASIPPLINGNPAVSQIAASLGLPGAIASLKSDRETYDQTIGRDDARAQQSALLGIISDSSGAAAGAATRIAGIQPEFSEILLPSAEREVKHLRVSTSGRAVHSLQVRQRVDRVRSGRERFFGVQRDLNGRHEMWEDDSQAYMGQLDSVGVTNLLGGSLVGNKTAL